MRLVTAEQMVALERAADATGHDYESMMRRAGGAVAREILARWPEGRALILAGPGNNGGDGLVCAALLADAGWQVRVATWQRSPDHWLADLGLRGIPSCHQSANEAGELDPSCAAQLETWLADSTLVVDALLGTGLTRPLAGVPAGVLDRLRTARSARSTPARSARTDDALALVAVDVPTGLFADDGRLDPHVVPADLTVTFGAAKRGQLFFPGAATLGRLVLDPIGIPEAAARAGLTGSAASPDRIATRDLAADLLPPRPLDGHKGSFGRLLVLAGAAAYPGAALLAARAAGRAGAGLVTLAAIPAVRDAIAAAAPEITHLSLPAAGGVLAEEAAEPVAATLADCDALLVGCGLTALTGPTLCLHSLLADDRLPLLGGRLVIDADGLNILARDQALLHALPAPAVLTPHPGEMARLMEQPVADILADRLETARSAAMEWGHVLVLKGAPTVVAAPDGRTTTLPVATTALASAGTGDILAGLIAGLLAQGADPYAAAVAGTIVHGLAGVRTAKVLGSRAPIAADILERIGPVLAELESPATLDGGPTAGLLGG